MIYKSRSELLRAAADSIEMQEKGGVKEPVCKTKNMGVCSIQNTAFYGGECDYEFPLAVIESKPVFVGDEPYCVGVQRKVIGVKQGALLWESGHGLRFASVEHWSWHPPKPRKVLVEISVEDAKYLTEIVKNCNHDQLTNRLGWACKKALEELK